MNCNPEDYSKDNNMGKRIGYICFFVYIFL